MNFMTCSVSERCMCIVQVSRFLLSSVTINFTWLENLHVPYVNIRIPYFKKKKGDNNILVTGGDGRKIENFNPLCSE